MTLGRCDQRGPLWHVGSDLHSSLVHHLSLILENQLPHPRGFGGALRHPYQTRSSVALPA